MNKIILATLLLVSLSLISIPTVLAPAPTGNIIITPPWPVESNSPATLQISVVPPADPTYDPHVLLAITPTCYNGLTDIEVAWEGGSTTFLKADFTLLEGEGVEAPSSGISEKRYTRSALASHLGLPGSSPVYYAMGPFLDGEPIHSTPRNFTVTAHSTHPKVTVYALGKGSLTDELFSRWVPPTNPALVVPEVAPTLLAISSFCALALFAVKRKKTPKLL